MLYAAGPAGDGMEGLDDGRTWWTSQVTILFTFTIDAKSTHALTMSLSRNAVAAATRPLARRAGAAASPRFALRRASSTVSTSGSSHAGKKYGGDPKSSDAPWIIGSTLFFGGAFLYVTSPASKTHNEHGHITGAKTPSEHGTGSSRVDDKTGDEAVWKQEDHDGSHEEHVAPDDDAPEGDKHLHHNTQRGSADQQKSPKIADRSNTTAGIENSNFKVSRDEET